MCQQSNSELWDSHTNPISLFSQISLQEINVNNIKNSLTHISDFISYRELKNNRKKDIPFLKEFSQVVFDFVIAIFKSS